MSSDPAATMGAGPAVPTVVQAITRLNIGGPARHVLDLSTGLGDRYAMHVVTGTAPPEEGELDCDGVAVHRLPLVRAIAPHRDWWALVGMRRFLGRHQPALVHSHMAKAGAVARMAAGTIRPRPRTIHTFHGHVLSGYFGSRAEQTFAEIERRLARRTDLLVAVSDEVRDALLDLGIGRPSQFEVVPLGVDLEPYLKGGVAPGGLRGQLRLDERTPLIGVVARLAPIKDHRTLLRALVDLPEAHLAVLGDGELRHELEGTAASLGIAERTHFLGWCDDLPSALADVDVVALTSLNEGTPMALIEAAAAGRPVVATDVGGVGRIVIDGVTGLLVPPADPASVSRALERLLEDPDLRSRLGRAGRRHVVDSFGLQSSLDRIDELYREVSQIRRSG